MAMKFENRNSVAQNVNKKRDKVKSIDQLSNIYDINITQSTESVIKYEQISVDDIVPRYINKYRQSRIEQLAESIRNTNCRLIHPIVLVRGCDLPKEHEVRIALEKQGRNVDEIKYIIVSGERRYRAWLLLREQEKEKIGDKIGITNQFDTITANVLTEIEAINEKAFYADSNNQARQLSPAEAVWFIKDALAELDSPEKKREALIKLNNGSNEGIDDDPKIASRRFRIDNYCRYLLENEMGISEWSDHSIRNMATVALNCDDKIIDALLSGDFILREAKNITSIPKEQQVSLLELFKSDRNLYNERLEELKKSGKEKPKKTTHADTRKLLKSCLKRTQSEKEELEKISKELGVKDNKNEVEAIKRMNDYIMAIKILIENTK